MQKGTQKELGIVTQPPLASGVVRYDSAWLGDAEADVLFSALCEEVPWRQEHLRLYGREVLVPRRVAWCGEAGVRYCYSGAEHVAAGWYTGLEALASRISRELGVSFNFVLLNRYEDGRDYMGWHRDDEAELAGPVASVSLGARRRFLLREDGAARSQRLDLEHGSLLVFDGGLRHSLPRCARSDPRLNLTFRRIEAGAA